MWIVLLMALSYAFGSIQWNTADAIGTIYTVSGLAFQPKALRFFGNGLSSASPTTGRSNTTHERCFGGFATSTSDRRCVGVQDQDATASATCTTGYFTDCVAMTLTATGPARDGALDLNSITSDGFTLIVNVKGPVNITVFWEAWGGADITVATTGEIAEPAATGNVDYTVTGFAAADTDDQVVMFFGVQGTGAAGTVARNDSGFCVGYATGGAAAENVVITGNSANGAATMITDNYALHGECLAQIVVGGGNPNARATLTQFGVDNFRLNWLARGTTSRKSIFLAIKGGNWRAGFFTIDAATLNATATVSGLPFTPIGVSAFTLTDVESTAGTSTAQNVLDWGCGTSPTSRQAMMFQSNDAQANATLQMEINYSQFQTYTDATAAATILADNLNAMNSGGFQIITTVVAVGAPATEWHGYLTFGNIPVGDNFDWLQRFPAQNVAHRPTWIQVP